MVRHDRHDPTVFALGRNDVYELRDSWLVDSEADINICNDCHIRAGGRRVRAFRSRRCTYFGIRKGRSVRKWIKREAPPIGKPHLLELR